MISQEQLKDQLRYDQHTGEFTRAKRASNQLKGARAGAVRGDGYVVVQVNGKQYLAHRLAWLYVTGSWPGNTIDHIDRNPSNNAFSNLRGATDGQNKQNVTQARRHNKSSGLLGVTIDRRRKNNPWRAEIRVAGDITWLGAFPTKELAKKAYDEAKAKLHPFAVSR